MLDAAVPTVISGEPLLPMADPCQLLLAQLSIVTLSRASQDFLDQSAGLSAVDPFKP